MKVIYKISVGNCEWLGKWPTWCTNSFLCVYFCL